MAFVTIRGRLGATCRPLESVQGVEYVVPLPATWDGMNASEGSAEKAVSELFAPWKTTTAVPLELTKIAGAEYAILGS